MVLIEGSEVNRLKFDFYKKILYNIIKEVAERKLFNLIKNKQNC